MTIFSSLTYSMYLNESRISTILPQEDTQAKLLSFFQTGTVHWPNPARFTTPWHIPLYIPPTLGFPGYESAYCHQEARQHFLHQDLTSKVLFSVGNLDNLLQAQHSLENLSQLQMKNGKENHTQINTHTSFRKPKKAVKKKSTKHKESWHTSQLCSTAVFGIWR